MLKPGQISTGMVGGRAVLTSEPVIPMKTPYYINWGASRPIFMDKSYVF